MTVPIARINAYRQAVVRTIKATMPALRECETQFGRFNLEELETTNIKTPAVRFGVLSAKVKPEPDGHSEAVLSCAAFVVTEGKDRDEHAWAIAEAISVLLHSGQLFGMTKLSAPAATQILPVVTGKLKTRGVSIIAVEWSQQLRQIGQGIFDADKVLVEAVYLNNELVDVG
ncbi:MAG: hypothetical protein M3036_16405, partial [Bifidobacteriales bacterium]|nr:hypothetical protein [Bifidobacteriales bacterium]